MDADLTGAVLVNAILTGASLLRAGLDNANLSHVHLYGADFREAKLMKANLVHAELYDANFREARLNGANLRGANLRDANLNDADLSDTDLRRACLDGADFRKTKLCRADLRRADLRGALLVETDLSAAKLDGCLIYGVSAWGVKLDGAEQKNLIIAARDAPGEPAITVDNLEVAQFIYLILNNEKIRDVINTVGQKAVLILGRFSAERKEILEAIADALRERGYLPIIFDFEKSQERDFTETIKTLAGLSLFVIVDITNPKSSPLELQATVPDYRIPFVPIIQKGEEPFSMFKDLTIYDWVLKPVRAYETKERLLLALDDKVIRPALAKHVELVKRKAEELETEAM